MGRDVVGNGYCGNGGGVELTHHPILHSLSPRQVTPQQWLPRAKDDWIP
jgi:hypothetical protein